MVRWLHDEKAYEIKEKLSNGQTIFIQFQDLDAQNPYRHFDNRDYRNYNVCLGIYSKRKHANRNEEECRITGKAPFLNVYKALKMFDEIESYVIEETSRTGGNARFLVRWVDNRRRDAYEKVLSKRGYTYKNFWGYRYLAREIKGNLQK